MFRVGLYAIKMFFVVVSLWEIHKTMNYSEKYCTVIEGYDIFVVTVPYDYIEIISKAKCLISNTGFIQHRFVSTNS